MRPLHWATLDKRRPVLLLTREVIVGRMSSVTVAPITTTVHGLATEVQLGVRNGLADSSAAKCDQITTIPFSDVHEQCGWLLASQEPALHKAIQAAFDLD